MSVQHWTIECDRCRKIIERRDTRERAIEWVRRQGWTINDEGTRHTCPACSEVK